MKTITAHPVYIAAAAGKYIDGTDLAKLIKSAIKRAYPKLKCSVTQSRGCAIYVRWSDGPTTKEIEAVAEAFETRSFDGMIDMAHSNSLWLYPDGSAHCAHDSGTEGSGGVHAEHIASPRRGDAVLLDNVASLLVSCSRRFSVDFLRCAAEVVKKTNWADLADYDWSTLEIHDTGYGAYITGSASSQRAYGGYLSELIHRTAHEMSN